MNMSTTTTGASQKTIFSKILVAIDGSDASMDAAVMLSLYLKDIIIQNFMLCML